MPRRPAKAPLPLPDLPVAAPPSKPTAAARRRAHALQWDDGVQLVAGVDEVGRGPLAGPVVVAAVILKPRERIVGLRDSKRLSARTRERLHDEIRAKALCCSIAEATLDEIERLNILGATLLAMRRAVERLRLRPQLVRIDGNRLPTLPMPCEGVIGGDDKVAAIAAASVLAKVHRDRWCAEIDRRFPQYGFARHKGYGTAEHLAAIAQHGPCEVHRLGFAPFSNAGLATASIDDEVGDDAARPTAKDPGAQDPDAKAPSNAGPPDA
jgi:ribonuclease HII